MGRDKASLPFGPGEVLLQRCVRIVASVVGLERVVVVSAPGQVLPELPAAVIRCSDRRPDQGPLEGLAVGLAAIPAESDHAFVTSCDVPLLKPAFIERTVELLLAGGPSRQIVVPVEDRFAHPLAAVYRTSVLPQVEALLAEDRRRPVFLFETCETLQVPVEQFRDIDPELRSLRNCNRPGDYERALESAGFADLSPD